MSVNIFDFINPAGDRLAGRLDMPQGAARAWALFAHCFTCGKDSLSAVRMARGLARAGVGVLRFDFAGLGTSEGTFANTSFSMNVQDLVAAAAAMATAGMPPSLLIGHSLGGAAALAAASEIPSLAAVATIAAPFDVAHLLRQFDPVGLADIEAHGQGKVTLGGRPFTVGKGFIDDLHDQDQSARIAALRCPLLILHGPLDETVGIDNATQIFLSAHHPKSFVSLGSADHLLSDRRDADYAATMIAGWASRYLPDAIESEALSADAVAQETGLGKFQLEMRSGGARWLVDEPKVAGGLGSGPSPYDLLSSALAACTTMTLRHYADNHGWAVKRIATAVDHRKDVTRMPNDAFSRRIFIDGEIDEAQRTELLEVAERCPVHRTLKQGSQFESTTAQ